jgi:hypothetical protein
MSKTGKFSRKVGVERPLSNDNTRKREKSLPKEKNIKIPQTPIHEPNHIENKVKKVYETQRI